MGRIVEPCDNEHACYAQAQMTAQSKKIAGATTALVLLTALNFLNYIDRYMLAGEMPLVQQGVTHHGLHPTDACRWAR